MKSLRQRQAADTRARIIAAARELLEQRGYEATRVEDIAASAGVAIPTVYKAFANKRKLLGVVIATAMAGNLDASIAEQPWWQEQLAAPDAKRQLELIARNARQIYERAGRLLELLRNASGDDPEIESLARRLEEERRRRSVVSARALQQKAGVKMARASDAANTLWALTSPEIYLLQVQRGGLTGERYERWLSSLLCRALVPE